LIPNFDKYRPIRIISRGGQSEIWLVEKNGMKFAAKIPIIPIYETPVLEEIDRKIRRIRHEIEIWKRLNHRNIAKVIEIITVKYVDIELPCIIMEYCEKNLREVIMEKGKLNPKEAISIIIKLLDALEYAHQQGIIHRDLKPENILICNGEPKISDWGIAKIISESFTGTIKLATPLYSAPEQLDPEKYGKTDLRTDLWQIGVIFYELLTGKSPFEGRSLSEIIFNILNREPPKSQLINDVLMSIITRALKKRKEERWSSATAMKTALINALNRVEAMDTERILAVSEVTQIVKPITYAGHSKPVLCVAWSSNNKYLASGSEDKTVRIWNIENGELVEVLKNHEYPVTCVAWSQDNRYIASGSSGGKPLKGFLGGIVGETISLIKMRNTIKIWDFTTREVIRELKGHTDKISSIAWSPNGKLLASSGKDERIIIWDVQQGKIYRTLSANGGFGLLTGYGGWVTSLSWNRDGRQIVGGLFSSVIKIWDIQNRKIIRVLRDHKSAVWSVAWSPDGKYIASGSGDNTIRIWDAQNGWAVRVLRGHKSAVRSVAWSPDGKYIASGSKDRSVRVWDAYTGEAIWVF